MQKPENYEKDSLFVFSAFKPLDFKWLRQMVFKEKLVRLFLNRRGIKVRSPELTECTPSPDRPLNRDIKESKTKNTPAFRLFVSISVYLFP